MFRHSLPSKLDVSKQPNSSGGLVVPQPQISPLSSLPDFSFEDLGLMHFYSTSTCFTIADANPALRDTWQRVVPQEALCHPFLMHGVLSLAALHQVSLHTDYRQQKFERAIYHHQLALTKSKAALQTLTEDNCGSLFVLSATIAIFSLARPISPASDPLQDPVSRLLELTHLIGGSRIIVHAGYSWLEKSTVSPLLHSGFLKSKESLPDNLEYSIRTLESEIPLGGNDEAASEAYRDALENLRTCFRNIDRLGGPDRTAQIDNRVVVLSWLATMHEGLTILLSDRDPLALSILAHYAVILHTLDGIWWSRTWGHVLFRNVYEQLDPPWRRRVEWAKKNIHSAMSLSSDHAPLGKYP